jgi:hypothetical protein
MIVTTPDLGYIQEKKVSASLVAIAIDRGSQLRRRKPPALHP